MAGVAETRYRFVEDGIARFASSFHPFLRAFVTAFQFTNSEAPQNLRCFGGRFIVATGHVDVNRQEVFRLAKAEAGGELR